MEMEGLSRAIDFLSANSLTIHTLVTDRHKQITKFINKKHPNIEHRYDVWHVSKGTYVNHMHTQFSLWELPMLHGYGHTHACTQYTCMQLVYVAT